MKIILFINCPVFGVCTVLQKGCPWHIDHLSTPDTNFLYKVYKVLWNHFLCSSTNMSMEQLQAASNAVPSAFAFFYNIRMSINKTSQQLFLLGLLLSIIWDALVNEVSLGAAVWTTTLMCDVLVLKMASHLWPITRWCIIPPLWQQQECRTIR